MKIAILGDSYSSSIAFQGANHFKSWSELLTRKYEVNNYSENGSSLYYMKSMFFDKIYNEYEKIIFCITAPGRITFKVDTAERNPEYVPWYRHIPTIWTIDARIHQIKELTDLDKKRYKILYDYILEIQDIEYEEYIHRMMVLDILKKRPDALLIPAFPTSLVDQVDCLENVTKMEDAVFGKRTGFYGDERKCHMSAKNNEILADLVEKALLSDDVRVDLQLGNFVKPSPSEGVLLIDL